MKEDKKRISAIVNKDVVNRLEEDAKENKRSKSAQLELILEEHYEQKEKKSSDKKAA